MASATPLMDFAQAGVLSSVDLWDLAGNMYSLKPVEGQGVSVYKNGVNIGLNGLKKISAKTGTTYTVLASELGTLFTNRGAGGNIAFTLPATAGIAAGWWCRFFCVAAGTVTVSSPDLNTMTVFNNATTADSIAFSTSSEIIGNGLEVVWDGTGWLVFVMLGAETSTPTIGT